MERRVLVFRSLDTFFYLLLLRKNRKQKKNNTTNTIEIQERLEFLLRTRNIS